MQISYLIKHVLCLILITVCYIFAAEYKDPETEYLNQITRARDSVTQVISDLQNGIASLTDTSKIKIANQNLQHAQNRLLALKDERDRVSGNIEFRTEIASSINKLLMSGPPALEGSLAVTVDSFSIIVGAEVRKDLILTVYKPPPPEPEPFEYGGVMLFRPAIKRVSQVLDASQSPVLESKGRYHTISEIEFIDSVLNFQDNQWNRPCRQMLRFIACDFSVLNLTGQVTFDRPYPEKKSEAVWATADLGSAKANLVYDDGLKQLEFAVGGNAYKIQISHYNEKKYISRISTEIAGGSLAMAFGDVQ